MAYTGTTAQKLTLKTAVQTHPDFTTADNITAILGRLNDPAQNAGAQTGVPPLTADTLMGVLWTQTTATQLEFSLGLLYSMSADPQTDFSRHRAAIINEANVGLTNAIEALTRPLNEAEVLFGGLDGNGIDEFVTITDANWVAARDS